MNLNVTIVQARCPRASWKSAHGGGDVLEILLTAWSGHWGQGTQTYWGEFGGVQGRIARRVCKGGIENMALAQLPRLKGAHFLICFPFLPW